MNFKNILITLLLCANSFLYANSFDNIKKFAQDICDNIDPNGSIKLTEIEAGIAGNIKPLSKILGIKFEANGTFKIKDESYTGLPYDSLPAQMIDSRRCKQELAFMLLEQKSIIDKKQDVNIIHYYLESKHNSSVHIFGQPMTLKNITKRKKICEVESGTSAEKISEHKNKNGDFVKIRVLNGTCQSKMGWIGKSDLHIKQKD
ncbi:MAG: hypothetical protein U9R39_06825 [Campylobacterota bacterium]|nr:hypothetical protein [Campylobacterota bacterium]